jgi:hypothetical protein
MINTAFNKPLKNPVGKDSGRMVSENINENIIGWLKSDSNLRRYPNHYR